MTGVANRHGSQAHDRTVATGRLRPTSRLRGVPALDELVQGSAGRDANIETAAIHRILSMLHPLDIAAGLVVQVPAHRSDAVSQRKCHPGIVGPFTGIQAMWPTTAIAGNGCEAAWAAELDVGTQRLAYGQADQGSSEMVGHDSGTWGHFCDFKRSSMACFHNAGSPSLTAASIPTFSKSNASMLNRCSSVQKILPSISSIFSGQSLWYFCSTSVRLHFRP